MDLRAASALVTGGGGGLGAGAVRNLVAAGMKVVIADFSEENGKSLAAELGGEVEFVKTNVLDDDSLQAAVDAASALGPLRVSVAAHGGGAAVSRILDREGKPYALDLFRRTVELYLTGTFNVTRLAAAAMAKTEPLESDQRLSCAGDPNPKLRYQSSRFTTKLVGLKLADPNGATITAMTGNWLATGPQ